MDTRIRSLEPADVDAVMALADRLTIGMPPWRDADAVGTAIRGWLAGSTAADFDGDALVATVDGELAGFISLSTTGHFAGDTDAYIGELIVDERYEGSGIGRLLVGAAEELAIEHGHRCITLTTGGANERARAFYDRLGYGLEDVNYTKVLGA